MELAGRGTGCRLLGRSCLAAALERTVWPEAGCLCAVAGGCCGLAAGPTSHRAGLVLAAPWPDTSSADCVAAGRVKKGHGGL